MCRAWVSLFLFYCAFACAEHTPPALPHPRAEETLREVLDRKGLRLALEPAILEVDVKDIAAADCAPAKKRQWSLAIEEFDTESSLNSNDKRWNPRNRAMVRDFIEIIAEEKRAVETRFPELVKIGRNDSFWDSYSISYPTTRDGFHYERAGAGKEYTGELLLSDFSDRRRLRLKIYEKAFSLLERSGKPPYPSVLAAVLADVGLPTKLPPEKLTREKASQHAFFHRLADEVESKDPGRAECLRRSSNRRFVGQIAAGNPYEPSHLAIGEMLNRFKHDLGKAEWFNERLVASVTDRDWTLSKAMKKIEGEVPEAERAAFAKLRDAYGLDEKTLLDIEKPRQPEFLAEIPKMKGGVASVEQILQEPNVEHKYRVTRAMVHYEIKLGPEFKKSLEKLGTDSHWIDAGSGEGHAIFDYLKTGKAKVTGVTLKMDRKPEANERHLVGRYIEKIPNEEIGKADLIIDVVGPFAYTNQVDVVLEKYLELLKPGGAILVSTDFDGGNVRLKNGKVVSIFEWTQTIPGLKAEITGNRYGDPKLKITVTDRAKIKVPKLKLVASDSGLPPSRLYRED